MSPGKKRKRYPGWKMALVFLAPFTVVYLLFLIYPTIQVLYLSFTNADIAGIGEFTGVQNYVKLLFKDPVFWRALGNTVYFILLTVVPNTLVGLLLAFLLEKMRWFKGLAQVFFFLPYILPVSVVTQIWLWVLNTNYGVYNFFLGNKINWFQTPNVGMPAVAFITIWWTVGFNVLLFIAGLKSIPREYYEAAAIDGADRGFTVFWRITWPLLWPVTSLVLLLQLIAQWQIFNQIYLLTSGGPFNSTTVVLHYMYVEAFQKNHGGYASTISIALFVIILITSLIQLRLLRLRGNT